MVGGRNSVMPASSVKNYSHIFINVFVNTNFRHDTYGANGTRARLWPGRFWIELIVTNTVGGRGDISTLFYWPAYAGQTSELYLSTHRRLIIYTSLVYVYIYIHGRQKVMVAVGMYIIFVVLGRPSHPRPDDRKVRA